MSCCSALISHKRTFLNVYDPDIFKCSGHSHCDPRQWRISTSTGGTGERIKTEVVGPIQVELRPSPSTSAISDMIAQ